MKLFLILILLRFAVQSAYAPEPTYSNILKGCYASRNDLLEAYFLQGYSYSDISTFLLTMHGLALSVHSLKKIYKAMGLRRRNTMNHEKLKDLLRAIIEEKADTGENLGYKAMWVRLRSKGINVPRRYVRRCLKHVDPVGTNLRRRNRLKRRTYSNPGPNFCWHFDGYDKLKPFGFPIHGCIDGFSRRIMWLNVGPTNNNPQVVALHYLNTLLELKTVPCLLRCDRGTENVHIHKIQVFLRRNDTDCFSGRHSFMYGKSTGNQRIEAWWSILRRQCTDFWISRFKTIAATGVLNVDDPVHIQCLRFCFLSLLQRDLSRMVIEWNTHRINARKIYGQISGKPDKMYFLPEEFDVHNYGCSFNERAIIRVKEELEQETGHIEMVHPSFVRVVNVLIPEWKTPQSYEEGLQLFCKLIVKIRKIPA